MKLMRIVQDVDVISPRDLPMACATVACFGVGHRRYVYAWTSRNEWGWKGGGLSGEAPWCAHGNDETPSHSRAVRCSLTTLKKSMMLLALQGIREAWNGSRMTRLFAGGDVWFFFLLLKEGLESRPGDVAVSLRQAIAEGVFNAEVIAFAKRYGFAQESKAKEKAYGDCAKRRLRGCFVVSEMARGRRLAARAGHICFHGFVPVGWGRGLIRMRGDYEGGEAVASVGLRRVLWRSSVGCRGLFGGNVRRVAEDGGGYDGK